MGDVIGIKGGQQPDEVLDGCKGEFKSVIVIGVDENEVMSMNASSDVLASDALWLLEALKLELLTS